MAQEYARTRWRIHRLRAIFHQMSLQRSLRGSGEPATKPTEPLAVRNGPEDVKPLPNGPLQVKGPLEIVSGTGRTTDRAERVFFCRCGASANKPYCDGTHNKIGFTAE